MARMLLRSTLAAHRKQLEALPAPSGGGSLAEVAEGEEGGLAGVRLPPGFRVSWFWLASFHAATPHKLCATGMGAGNCL